MMLILQLPQLRENQLRQLRENQLRQLRENQLRQLRGHKAIAGDTISNCPTITNYGAHYGH